MTGTVNIGGAAVPMRADGSTPYKYAAIHGSSRDLVQMLYNGTEDDAGFIDMMTRLAYTMNVQAAEDLDPGSLGEKDFVAWCADFGPTDLIAAAPEIYRFYRYQAEPSSEAKKKSGEPSGK